MPERVITRPPSGGIRRVQDRLAVETIGRIFEHVAARIEQPAHTGETGFVQDRFAVKAIIRVIDDVAALIELVSYPRQAFATENRLAIGAGIRNRNPIVAVVKDIVETREAIGIELWLTVDVEKRGVGNVTVGIVLPSDRRDSLIGALWIFIRSDISLFNLVAAVVEGRTEASGAS